MEGRRRAEARAVHPLHRRLRQRRDHGFGRARLHFRQRDGDGHGPRRRSRLRHPRRHGGEHSHQERAHDRQHRRRFGDDHFGRQLPDADQRHRRRHRHARRSHLGRRRHPQPHDGLRRLPLCVQRCHPERHGALFRRLDAHLRERRRGRERSHHRGGGEPLLRLQQGEWRRVEAEHRQPRERQRPRDGRQLLDGQYLHPRRCRQRRPRSQHQLSGLLHPIRRGRKLPQPDLRRARLHPRLRGQDPQYRDPQHELHHPHHRGGGPRHERRVPHGLRQQRRQGDHVGGRQSGSRRDLRHQRGQHRRRRVDRSRPHQGVGRRDHLRRGGATA